MPNKIIPKRSTVAGKVPTTGDLDVGEIAINLTDGKLFSRNAGGVIEIGGGSSSPALIFTGFDGGSASTTAFDLTLDLGDA
jgi:hypothetical protein